MSSNPEKMEVASWDGSLSRTEFYVAAGAFAEQWNKFNSALPQCSWLPRSTLPWLSATTSQVFHFPLSLYVLTISQSNNVI